SVEYIVRNQLRNSLGDCTNCDGTLWPKITSGRRGNRHSHPTDGRNALVLGLERVRGQLQRFEAGSRYHLQSRTTALALERRGNFPEGVFAYRRRGLPKSV